MEKCKINDKKNVTTSYPARIYKNKATQMTPYFVFMLNPGRRSKQALLHVMSAAAEPTLMNTNAVRSFSSLRPQTFVVCSIGGGGDGDGGQPVGAAEVDVAVGAVRHLGVPEGGSSLYSILHVGRRTMSYISILESISWTF